MAGGADHSNPFKGRVGRASALMTVLHRFTKPGGHWAEIRERKVSTFGALELIVFMDDSLLESEMFHGGRLPAYRPALEARIAQFVDGGWIEDPAYADKAH